MDRVTMNGNSTVELLKQRIRKGGDRIGVWASALCIIHCIAAPILLLLSPHLGRWWSSPLAHLSMALFVVPLAIMKMSQGYQKLRSVRLVASGSLGIALVLAGVVAPFFQAGAAAVPAESNGTVAQGAALEEGEACTKTCCAKITKSETGGVELDVPLASSLTTIGGILLVAMHIGNLCLCPSCRTDCSGNPQS